MEGGAAEGRTEYQSGWLSYWSILPYSGCTSPWLWMIHLSLPQLLLYTDAVVVLLHKLKRWRRGLLTIKLVLPSGSCQLFPVRDYQLLVERAFGCPELQSCIITSVTVVSITVICFFTQGLMRLLQFDCLTAFPVCIANKSYKYGLRYKYNMTVQQIWIWYLQPATYGL